MKGMREKRMRNRFKLSRIVLKTERELVLEKESILRISTKRKGVCKTHERERVSDDNN